MSEFDSSMAVDVVVACEHGSSRAAQVLSQVLESELSLAVDPKPGTYDPANPPAWAMGGGLALTCHVGGTDLVMLLPYEGGVLPPWVQKPDTAQSNKLGSLARELAMLLLPESLVPEKCSTTWVPHLAEALARCEVAAGAAVVTLDITGQEKISALYVVWPCTAVEKVVPEETTSRRESDNPQATTAEPKQATTIRPQPKTRSLGDLPPYARHLLKIEVPVMVNLVSKKQSIEEIMQLGPGAIVNFEKSCDDPLELMVGNRRVALGSAVKVGDKFGIEITEISLPDESFQPVRRTRAG
jgi:flagellar motor switch protein FliN/FliY